MIIILVITSTPSLSLMQKSCWLSVVDTIVQVVLVSATLPNEILEMTDRFMTDPIRILVKRDELTLEVGAWLLLLEMMFYVQCGSVFGLVYFGLRWFCELPCWVICVGF